MTYEYTNNGIRYTIVMPVSRKEMEDRAANIQPMKWNSEREKQKALALRVDPPKCPRIQRTADRKAHERKDRIRPEDFLETANSEASERQMRKKRCTGVQ
jgi:hypothetical protein